MYRLSDQQINYILNDIRARGVEMEDLQQNLLDHICCIIEHDLEENGDFESFYQKTIHVFYKTNLWEIEEETINLLTFKNYYVMKKLMIWSGAFSAFTLTVGIWFKYMHWPGVSLFVPTGILSGSLVFLPLLFTLKAKEKQTIKDKFIMGVGALGIVLVSLSFLFKVMHWPHSIDMIYLSAAIMLLVFLPVFFFSGVRRPETKLNTIITSMLVILVYGLLFMMIRPPRATLIGDLKAIREFSSSQEILRNERWLARHTDDSLPSAIKDLNEQMQKVCEESKSYIFWRDFSIDTTSTSHYHEFDSKKKLITDQPFDWDQTFQEKLNKLGSLVMTYNLELSKLKNKRLSLIPLKASLLDNDMNGTYMLTTANVLNQLTQIQMFLLQNTRSLVATK